MTFDLDLDLKHTPDAGLPDDHLVKVWWRSGHLSARRSDLRKSLQTDRQTDDGRLAIVLAHTWNELKKSVIYLFFFQFLFFGARVRVRDRRVDLIQIAEMILEKICFLTLIQQVWTFSEAFKRRCRLDIGKFTLISETCF